ncbi:glycerophosphoryl diester phosphodiesterase family [Rubidibacter lacunae KORDI 51-2]|uniref:glycerophosphodiester phosphodiesterase n=1 Tax=Rubidibacter lacunae KORDI 51-2 TaxID=582515 RepID=U5DQN4_9CHRO|nr:glycerophosphodiester phosphodiesterase family protein [Rubidibacter lacunae]ERN41995.1 glycerophosphoryl diester phosphodiesterase family [Rubidibacter lacunae KORDI 51-2]
MTKLVGFASLPADTFAAGPPAGEGISANGRMGPFPGQPVQGFSGVQFDTNKVFWFLSDNGFGSQDNSSDYLLRLYRVDPSFVGSESGDGSVDVLGFVGLSDPNGLIPFDIINEDTESRLLTGADFDIESFVIDNNADFWIGDEFGPFLLHFDSEGVLLEAPIPTPSLVDLNTLNGQEPLVIAHRGASGDFPEHTIEAYLAAIAAGADFVEPDLVITSDGVLIARHEPILDGTTNVADVFGPERQSTKNLDGEDVTAYFAEDFTLAEIKQLRAVQSRAGRDPSFDNLFEIPTFAEVIEAVKQVEFETGVAVGIYPETKHPTFFDQQGLSLEEPLIQTLQDTGFTDPSRIFIQSFEISNLLDLQGQLDAAGLSDIPLVQLFGDTSGQFINEGGGGFSVPYDAIVNADLGEAELQAIYGDLAQFIDFENPTYGDLTSQAAIDAIAQYASGIGPWKNNILLREPLSTPVDGNGDGVAEIRSQLTGEIFPLIERAHNSGLQIHPYTLRDEEPNLTLEPDGSPQTPEEEFEQLIELGADGFFTDFPRTGDPVRDRLVADEVRSPQNPDFDFENTLNGQTPLIIAHRGASGDFPEHTLEAYRLAIYQGADFVEPDLVTTSDGVLIARHEPILDGTTNVADVFGPERKSTKNLDGEDVTAYFAEDFTLEEIKQLRAVQPRAGRSPAFDGLFEIPTFEEVIELVEEVSPFAGRDIGIYPETKHPTFFDEQGLSLEEPLVQTLLDNGFTDPDRIFIQSFEIANLLDLAEQLDAAGIGNIPLVQLFGDTTGSFINEGGGGFSVPFDLVANSGLSEAELQAIYGNLTEFIDFENPTYGDLANAAAIAAISEYASGLGPWKNNILLRESIDPPVDGNGDGEAEIRTQLTGEVFPLIDFAHDAGMQIHPYTLRDEEPNLTLNPDGTPQSPGDEFRQLFDLGVDGVFTDFTRTGRTVLEGLIPNNVEEPNLRQSRGYEGMGFSPDRNTLYPMLEGTVFGDPEGSIRIYEFDVATSTFADELAGLYQLEEPNHAIGDLTPINDNEFLVIERDGGQGESAQFKKIFKIDLSAVDDEGFVEKEEVVDLLDIDDPNDLNGDGETTFDFPFVTIEDVLVLDENTILVANDNNYPFSVGRGPDIDNNEIIQIFLDTPLALADGLGSTAAYVPPQAVFGGFADDTLDSEAGDFDGTNAAVFGGSGDDTIDNSSGGGSRLYGGSGSNEFFAGKGDRVVGGNGPDTIDALVGGGSSRVYGLGGNDDFFLGTNNRASGGKGEDRFFFPNGDGDNTVTGGGDADQFWIASAILPEAPNTLTDFTSGEDVIGIAGIEGIMEFSDLSIGGEADATIAAGGVQLAILLGVPGASLGASDFAILEGPVAL